MTKTVMIFGIIPGIILCANAIYMMNRVSNNPNFETNDVIGYAAMVVVFSLIYFGVRNYRNKYMGGYLSFGKAFKAGALIALVASTVYVVIGLGYYYLFAPEFLDHYTAYVLRHTPADKLAAKTVELENFKEMYKNPVFAVLISYSEVLPVGLVVALVSALLLKKKRRSEALAAG